MFLAKRFHSLRRFVAVPFSTKVQPATQGGSVETRYRLQFTKSRLTDFGELPQGEIPEALKFDRPTNVTVLENGVKVATETWGSQLASITVAVKAGSRNETLETSGTASFIEKLNQRGTASKTRDQVEAEIDHLGGRLSVTTGRELQTYTLTFQANLLERAVNFLGDILQNSLYSAAQIEAERDGLYRRAVDMNDQQGILTELIHQNSFRDHFLSQPTYGIRENLHSVSADQIKEFHKTHFVGPNFTVSGAGNVNHEQLVKLTASAFGKLSSLAPATVPNSEKPFFTPSIMNVRDDEMKNLNIGVFFDAPNASHPDYFAMQYFQRIIGDYRADKYTGAHLNTAERQYSMMHSHLGNLPDVTLQKCLYFPYSDCGLFGNYLMGNEVFINQMVFLTPMILSEYSSFINQVEVFRARARVFNELLSRENSCAVSKQNAFQTNYWGRIVPRSEYAQRISAMDAGHLTRVANRFFWDKDISVVMWGPTHLLTSIAHYGRPWKRATLGAHAHMYYTS